MEEFEDDEIPPLEDMTETMNKLAIEKLNQDKCKKLNYLEPTSNEFTEKNKNVIKMLGHEKEEHLSINTASMPKKSSQKNGNFCGFKKGFLSGGTSNKQNAENDKVAKPIKYDVVKNNNVKTDEKVLPEVQEAMKTQIPLLQSNDWVTEDLLEKIMKNPKLSKQFMNPRFNEAISKFQSNPTEVMEECKTNEELRDFIQAFCALMGAHFTTLADKQGNEVASSVTPSTKQQKGNTNNNNSQEDSAKMQKILSDPEISRILKSPKVQELFASLKEDPNKAQRMLYTADGEFRYHIHKLIDAGLLQFAR